MLHKFPISKLTLALLTLPLASLTHAAGLDRSGQDVSAFLQDGTYAEAVYTYLDVDVSGHDNKLVANDTYVKGNKTGDIAESYDFFRYGVKTDINDTFSIGVLYDEPFGAEAAYSGNNNFVSRQGDADKITVTDQVTGLAKAAAAGVALGEETDVSVRSYSLTGILGMKLGENKNYQIYAGPVGQKVEGEVELRGIAYGPANGYNAVMAPDTAAGWLAGFSYSKPEIALKAALTYRSEIDHKLDAYESFSPGAIQATRGAWANGASKVKVTTPESVNFDFQTGINPTTLATAKVRWVPWSDFKIEPPRYSGATKLPLVNYSDDQWHVELGLGKKLADNFSVSGSIGWDSGAGDPTSSLGPVDGYYSVGLGAKYDMTKNWAISAGGKYLMLGDAKGSLPNGLIASDFQDNDGYAFGVKLSYQDK
ncbi:OmpP1/FadL family transporter [Psychrobacter sanguinis]|uniref:Aromatic hydrocarbon degradation protein n=1 Tax=Psychrobacter sanguinis TaxID=861445 RepID=A0A844M245_9GAMM|nr:outer membrane protein transport protein [Psychrobacter sanguinis]MUG32873.1 hypothetical protein [Psychrobacter sanguinis]